MFNQSQNQGIIDAYEKQDFNRAISLAKEARKLSAESLGINDSLYAQSVYCLLSLLLEANHKEEALSLMQELVTIRDQKMLNQIFPISIENQQLNPLQQIISEFYIFLSLIFQYLRNSPEAVKFAFNLILKRKAIRLEAATIQRTMIFLGSNTKLKK